MPPRQPPEPLWSGSELPQEQLVHVHDLPQLYQKPSASALLHGLTLLSIHPFSFASASLPSQAQIVEQGVPGYLTSIISSGLTWIEDEHLRESVWAAASARISERSGRSAMPDMTRRFVVNSELSLDLHEPSLTGDRLGLKTWASSLLLSRRLPALRRYIIDGRPRVLELGSGTGLVGLAAACIWAADVLLTDLPDIVPNLQHNLDLNRPVVEEKGGRVAARQLDWNVEGDVPNEHDKFPIIIAADPIYSPDHPKILVRTVRRWIHASAEARFIVELPLRDRYDEERQSLRNSLHAEKFELVTEGLDSGYDDWLRQDGSPAEVHSWWSIWRFAVG